MALPPTPQLPRRIVLDTGQQHDEALADSTSIYPGMLLAVQSDGGVLPHATAGGFAERIFAKEEALIGPPSETASVDREFVSGELVPIFVGKPGDRVNALLLAGSNYPVGTQLISHGDGTLYPTTGTPKQIIAVIDAIGGGVNLSATGAVNTRCSVRLV
jgi:hypothetical protein